MQLMDELPMIYGTCVFVFCLINTFPPYSNQHLHIAVLATYAALVTAVYLYIRHPVFHQVSYAFLVAITAITPILHMRRLRKDYPTQYGLMMFIFVLHTFSYLFGFFVWNVENLNCDRIRAWRDEVGYPFRIVAELHAWWHILTGYGTYGHLQLMQYFRYLALKRQDVQLKYWFLLPVISLVDKDEGAK
ncbi:Alkaline ceramidase 3, partial [Quaeritorhiza haematococci]